MDFDEAIQRLTRALKKGNPIRFNRYWVSLHAPKVYRFVTKNIKTALGRTDWDRVILKLDRSLQVRWFDEPIVNLLPYSDPRVVERLIMKYGGRHYVSFIYVNGEEEDNDVRNHISVTLVRLARRGNVAAEEELMNFLSLITGDWIYRDPQLWQWQRYPELLREKCKYCIYHYRYTGTFLGYLLKTLEYSALRLPRPLFLDKEKFERGSERKVEDVTQDAETGENRMADYNKYLESTVV